MNPHPEAAVSCLTAQDLLDRFGNIPLARIRFDVPPGTATEEDLLRIHDQTDRSCELVDGILVEKVIGYWESYLAGLIIHFLNQFVLPRRLGIVAGPDGMMRITRRRVRIPDVSFVSWARLPAGRVPTEPIPDLVPDLAVEVLSEGNTDQEMQEKRRDFFTHGCRLMWFVDHRTATVDVYTALDRSFVLREGQTLEGGEVLPGFSLRLADLFAKPQAP